MLVEHLKGVQLCRVRGDLDAATASVFREAAAAVSGQPRVVFDLSEVGFMDSCGLGALIGAIRRVRDSGGQVAVCSIRPPIMRLLRSVGLEATVALSPSVAAALEGFFHPAVA